MQVASNLPSLKKFAVTTVVLALLGCAIAVYATQHHLQFKASGSSDALCNISATVNCNAVASSAYSEVLGTPVAVWGLGYFVAAATLGLLFLSGIVATNTLMLAYATLVGAGVLTSLALGAISITKIGVVCPTCVATYAVTIAQAATLWFWRRSLSFTSFGALTNGIAIAVAAVALTVGGFKLTEKNSVSTNPQTAPTTAALAPQGPKLDIPINRNAYSGLGEDYRKGSDQAKVVIVEFADFQCPACQGMANNLRELAKIYGDAILVVFKNYPLDRACNKSAGIHQNACNAAIISRCAGQFGKFWQMHDLIYSRQDQISLPSLKSWAGEIGISPEQVDACLQSKDILAKIQDDVALGDRVNVQGTPALYINGRPYEGARDVNSLKLLVENLLRG